MGYRDDKLALSKAQSIGADADSTNYIDTEITLPGWEKGGPVGVVINVEVSCNGTTGVEFVICHKTSEPTLADATLQTTRVLKEDLVKGDEIIIWLPTGVPLLRYMRIYYNLITGDEIAFDCSAYVTMGLPTGGQK